jgi:hypothetical protein
MVSVKREWELVDLICHPHDGPVTAFVMVARATDLASRHPGEGEVIANILWETMRERGYLSAEALASS